MTRLVPLAVLLAFAACTPDVDRAPPTATFATPQATNLVVYPDPLVAETVAVVVRDRQGTPMAGARVTWSSEGDGATVDAIDAVSDSSGVARAAWHPGGWLGRQEVYAQVEALPKLTIGADARSYSLHNLVGTRGSVCGLDDAGKLYCPVRSARLLLTPANAQSYAALAVSLSELCAARIAGGIDCYTFPSTATGAMTVTRSVVGAPPLVYLIGSDASSGFCGLTADGVMSCWGTNREGRFGDGLDGDRPLPLLLDSPLRFTSVRLGAEHGCGITTVREVWCWGANGRAQLGLPVDAVPRRMPLRVPNLGPSSELAINGFGTNCVRGDDARVRCWGALFGTGLGLGLKPELGGAIGFPVTGPVLNLNAASALVGIQTGFLGLAQDGALYLWGEAGSGEFVDAPSRLSLSGRLLGLDPSDIRDAACGRALGGGTLCIDLGTDAIHAVLFGNKVWRERNQFWAIPEPKP